MHSRSVGPVAAKLLSDVVATGVTSKDSEDGSAVGPDEARSLMRRLAAHCTFSEVAHAIAELRALPASQRAMLTFADLDGLAVVMHDVTFFRPSIVGAFPQPSDCRALSAPERTLFEEAQHALSARYDAVKNAFIVAAGRGEGCTLEQQELNTLAARMRALNATVDRLMQPGRQTEELRAQLRKQHQVALARPTGAHAASVSA